MSYDNSAALKEIPVRNLSKEVVFSRFYLGLEKLKVDIDFSAYHNFIKLTTDKERSNFLEKLSMNSVECIDDYSYENLDALNEIIFDGEVINVDNQSFCYFYMEVALVSGEVEHVIRRLIRVGENETLEGKTNEYLGNYYSESVVADDEGVYWHGEFALTLLKTERIQIWEYQIMKKYLAFTE